MHCSTIDSTASSGHRDAVNMRMIGSHPAYKPTPGVPGEGFHMKLRGI